jgi:hypothetical protein
LNNALSDYALAYQYRPDNIKFANSYAYALLEQRDYATSEALLLNMKAKRRELAAQSPAARRPADQI